MASRTANQKRIVDWYVKFVRGLAMSLEATGCVVMFHYTYNLEVPFGPLVQLCYKHPESLKTGLPFPPLLFLLTATFSTVIGIVFDIAMFRFLKERRQKVSPQIAMVSWDHHQIQQPPLVSYGPNEKILRAMVPIKATCLGLVNLVIILLILYIGHFGLDSDLQIIFFWCRSL